MVQIAQARDEMFAATRLDPEHPWAQVGRGLARTSTNDKPRDPAQYRRLAAERHLRRRASACRPIWVPHSYPGCSQHAPNEHLPLALAREGLR